MFAGDNPIFHSVLNTVGQEIGKTSFWLWLDQSNNQ